MFDSIIIRRSLPGSPKIDMGLLAECLIFYNEVHLIADMSMLRLLVENIGLETTEELINRKFLRLSFSPFMTGTRTQSKFTQQESFDYCTFTKVSQNKNKPDFEALFFEMLEKGSGKKGKSRRVGSRIFNNVDIIELDKLVPIDKGIPEITRRDLDNQSFVKSAIETAIHHLSPDFQLAPNWDFRTIRHSKGFNILTNIDFGDLNKAKSEAHFPDPKSVLSRAYLMDTILKANEDLFLSAHYKSEIVTKSITSSIIELKLSNIMERTKKSEHVRSLFQKTVISDAKMIREVINKDEKKFKDILPLLDKSKEFKSWLQQKGDETNLIKEYYRNVIGKTWLEKLPGKILRFSTFTGGGILADMFITGGVGTVAGVALGFGNDFILDRLIKGWKPDHYIDQIEKFIT